MESSIAEKKGSGELTREVEARVRVEEEAKKVEGR